MRYLINFYHQTIYTFKCLFFFSSIFKLNRTSTNLCIEIPKAMKGVDDLMFTYQYSHNIQLYICFTYGGHIELAIAFAQHNI